VGGIGEGAIQRDMGVLPREISEEKQLLQGEGGRQINRALVLGGGIKNKEEKVINCNRRCYMLHNQQNSNT